MTLELNTKRRVGRGVSERQVETGDAASTS
jgi:hypothetical protein